VNCLRQFAKFFGVAGGFAAYGSKTTRNTN